MGQAQAIVDPQGQVRGVPAVDYRAAAKQPSSRVLEPRPPGRETRQRGIARVRKQGHPANAFTRFETDEIEQSIPSRFARIVERYPDRLAVKDKHGELTYGELDRAANRIARAILDQDAPGGAPVALVLDQGTRAVAAILGVLRAGKPYVFVDPGVASERNDIILKDSGARLMVTDAGNSSKRSAYHRLNAIDIDACADACPGSSERPDVAPDSPACLVFTSGSTGVPKGVVQSHRSLLAGTMNYTN